MRASFYSLSTYLKSYQNWKKYIYVQIYTYIGKGKRRKSGWIWMDGWELGIFFLKTCTFVRIIPLLFRWGEKKKLVIKWFIHRQLAAKYMFMDYSIFISYSYDIPGGGGLVYCHWHSFVHIHKYNTISDPKYKSFKRDLKWIYNFL